ncbi:SRPBCC domain-containing protein [Planococcus sp. N028]|uniref:SRPBCC domain-containing protein n=1 Tax=Planococcus shixiaomingii TaxID=3058393 RepID=A0ABT8N578_9BACL|nr:MULTISPECIES: SRPBCC domain-containing protein [unclassified Planococcus (in: firmicutes)]MDN7243043.1 SRPBCC domain-containing protein [Planococcus sp. N028]WKA54985.1 SRPBCC domain-containing protein [Planococcus sp. N022]
MAITSTIMISMARRFNANPKQVFDAWVKPELMKKWLFTSEKTNKVLKNDLRIGGAWEIVDSRDGVDYRAIGEYQEVREPNKLVFTFEMPQFSETVDIVRVTISQVREATEMLFTQEIVVAHEEEWTDEDADKALSEYGTQTEEGWSTMFDNLRQLVERNN